MRDRQLYRQPYCECRIHAGKNVKAEVADHKIPHRGDSKLFFDPDNLQSLTKQCHDSWKQSIEKGGADVIAGCDEDGQPLDPLHPWYDESRTQH